MPLKTPDFLSGGGGSYPVFSKQYIDLALEPRSKVP
jgi:hypothetical protein